MSAENTNETTDFDLDAVIAEVTEGQDTETTVEIADGEASSAKSKSGTDV